MLGLCGIIGLVLALTNRFRMLLVPGIISLGIIVLAVWLILFGVLTTSILTISFAYRNDLLALGAVVAGVLLLVQR